MKTIHVHTKKIIANTSNRPIGINVNFMRDEDANYPGQRPLVDALKEMGAGHIRYPGGEKSDFYLLSDFSSGRPQPKVHAGYIKLQRDHVLLDFDSFVEKASAVDAVPHVVVGYDKQERTGVTREQYLQNAVEWVRYANVTKGYGIKYWEIGNENWHNQTGTPEELAEIVTQFSIAMKQVDPSIQIGASGNTMDWWQNFLPKAAPFIDFLTISQYSCMHWKGYEYYMSHPEIVLIEQAQTALKAIDTCIPHDKDRLKVVICELNSMDYSEGGWPAENNLGHALVTFEIIGQMLQNERIAYGMIWNTRWMDEKEPNLLWYALDEKNNLLPPGQILSAWGQYLHDSLVDISRTPEVVTFASLDPKSGKLSLFLLNKSLEPVSVKLEFCDSTYTSHQGRILSGTGPQDTHPKWTDIQATHIEEIALNITLKPVSLTVLSLQ